MNSNINNHGHYMAQALELAEKAKGYTAPNPMVGCIIVNNNQIISTGYHKKSGLDHAEVEAINKYSGSLDGVTAYVTLEPCAFEGRTPSCAKMLAGSNISKVVVAVTDPDPRNNGKGIYIKSIRR